LDGKKLNFELKTPFDRVLQANKCSDMLPVLNAFRTIDWVKVKEDLALLGPTITNYTPNMAAT